jgi:hypothetical protein
LHQNPQENSITYIYTFVCNFKSVPRVIPGPPFNKEWDKKGRGVEGIDLNKDIRRRDRGIRESYRSRRKGRIWKEDIKQQTGELREEFRSTDSFPVC